MVLFFEEKRSNDRLNGRSLAIKQKTSGDSKYSCRKEALDWASGVTLTVPGTRVSTVEMSLDIRKCYRSKEMSQIAREWPPSLLFVNIANSRRGYTCHILHYKIGLNMGKKAKIEQLNYHRKYFGKPEYRNELALNIDW